MKKSFLKRFTGDLLYGIVSLVILNMVLSFGINPFLKRELGVEQNGQMLFFTAIMGYIASAVGSGINYGRMKSFTRHETFNGDYNCYLIVLAVISAAAALIGFAVEKNAAGATVIGAAVLIFATSVRYYADVEYRLYMNYRGFFFYYLIISAGYGVGFLLYRWTRSWVGIYLCGELAGLVFVGVTGHIFRGTPRASQTDASGGRAGNIFSGKPSEPQPDALGGRAGQPFLGRFFGRSPYFKEDAKACASLSATYLLSDFVSYADRMLLPVFVSNTANTYFYIASLVGKMASLLSTPLNGVITGHLTHYRGKFTKKMFAVILILLAGLAVLLTACSVLGSHIFVWLFYREEYEAVRSLFLLANAGQIFFFLSNTLMVVVLRFAAEKVQLLISVVYILLFAAVTLPLMIYFGIWGAAWGLFAVNVLKFLLIGGIGFVILGKEKNS